MPYFHHGVPEIFKVVAVKKPSVSALLLAVAVVLSQAPPSGQSQNSLHPHDVIPSLQRLYDAQCVRLVTSHASLMTGVPRIAQTQKLLSVRGVFTAHVSVEVLESARRCHTNRPLNIVLDFDEQTRLSLASLVKVPSYPRWIVFFDGDPAVALRGVNIEFDCVFLAVRAQPNTGGVENLSINQEGVANTSINQEGVANSSTQAHEDHGVVVINEAYRLRALAPLIVQLFANYSAESGLGKASQDFAIRRANLHGFKLRACVRNLPPLVTVTRANGSSPKIGGFFGSVWNVLEKELNFTTEFTLPSDGQTGIKLGNGTWTGCIAMMLANKSDVAVCDFTMTTDRIQASDFLFPALSARQRYYLVAPTNVNLSWDNFLAPFSPRLWVAVASSVALLSLALHLAHRCARSLGTEQHGLDISQAVIYMLGLACGQGHDTTPRAASGRIVYQVGALTGIVVSAAYAASLISYLTVAVKEFPVNSFEELLAKRFKLGLRSPSGQLTLFETTLDPLLRKVYAQSIQPFAASLPRTVDEGLLRVCAEPGYGFLTFPEALPKRLPCKLAPAPSIMIPIRYSMVTSKGCPFHGILNSNMLKILHSGALRGARLRFWPKEYSEVKQDFVEVSLPQSTPILAFVVAGVLAGTTVLCLEVGTYRSTGMWSRFKGSVKPKVRAKLTSKSGKDGILRDRIAQEYNE